jgi:glutathione synthase
VCNVSQGGRSIGAGIEEEERVMIEKLNPVLASLGVVFYGIDTLTGDDGRRLLSEINTLSIGGLPRIAEYSGQPVIRRAADLLWGYILANREFDKK